MKPTGTGTAPDRFDRLPWFSDRFRLVKKTLVWARRRRQRRLQCWTVFSGSRCRLRRQPQAPNLRRRRLPQPRPRRSPSAPTCNPAPTVIAGIFLKGAYYLGTYRQQVLELICSIGEQQQMTLQICSQYCLQNT